MLTVIRMIANRFCLGMPGPLIACSMASMPYLTNYIDRISSLPPSAGARQAAAGAAGVAFAFGRGGGELPLSSLFPRPNK